MDEQMLKTLRKQNFWMRLIALFMAGIFTVAAITAVILVPRATSVLNHAAQTLEEADTAVIELNKTAKKLSNIDFEGLMNDTQNLVADTQKLVEDSSEGINSSIGKLDTIDIDGLNEAISDLQAVVSPLARMFGK